MKISVAMCTYNGEKFLEEQIRSLLNQTKLPDEIVISDDCSQDSTLDIIKRMQLETTVPLRIFTHEQNIGVFNNFPFAISKCEGDIIFTCDQDDFWLPLKLERHLNVHENYPDTVLVYSNADVVNNSLDQYLYPLWEMKTIDDYDKGQASLLSLLYKGRSIAGCCMSFRRDFYEKILPIPEGIYHDDWIATSASLVGHIIGIPESLIKYRQHGNNVVGIVRGRKLSYYKSLFTNVKFYVDSDMYIYGRHCNVYDALKKHPYLSKHIDEKNIDDNLLLYKHRSSYYIKPFKTIIYELSQDLFYKRYRFLKGPWTYFKDIYNLAYVNVFIKH